MKPDIDQILEKYWEGNTSLEEELILREYFKGDDIAESHLPFKDLFVFFDHQASIQIPIRAEDDLDIDALLEKYWEGETSLAEESKLRHYFSIGPVASDHIPFAELFNYYSEQKDIKYPEVLRHLVHKSFSIKRVVFAAAAVFALVIGALTVMNNLKTEPTTNRSAMVNEIQDPEEAMRVTIEALALVSSKFRESQQSVRQNIGALEKASIFK
jgi:hypothetical protein